MSPAETPASRSAVSSALSDELTNVAVGRDPGRQLVHLVLHERDQRRQDERRLGTEHRGELIRERLSRAGRHERERVAAGDRRAHDVLLPGPEGVEAEELAQRCDEIGQAGEYRNAPRVTPVPSSQQRQVQRISSAAGSVVAREPVVGELVPVDRLVGVDVGGDAKPGRCVERAGCDADPLGVGSTARRGSSRTRLQKPRRAWRSLSGLSIQRSASVRRSTRCSALRRGERPDGAGPAAAFDAVADGRCRATVRAPRT